MASIDEVDAEARASRRHPLYTEEQEKHSVNDGNFTPKKTYIFHFWPTFLLFNALVVLSLVLLSVWMAVYNHGFHWRVDNVNFHSLFMTLGFLVLYSYAMLSYRIIMMVDRKCTKLFHMALYIVALIFVVVGLYVVWDMSFFTSMHSWTGEPFSLLFIIQFLAAFIAFQFPTLPQALRGWFLPYHVFWGVVVFSGGIGCILTGIAEVGSTKSTDTTERYLMNFSSISILAAGITVIYLMVTPEFSRSQRVKNNEHVPLQ